ncbi:unnamed protein product, partial [Heterosigma akashiwo]
TKSNLISSVEASSMIDANNTDDGNNDSSSIRPLHQHWWPVSVLTALDKSCPNGVELLGMRLVLFHDTENEEWKCLEDMCSHRFAPLSEGRVVTYSPQPKECASDQPAEGSGSSCKTCIQCAYHGWEFDGQGSCTHIPQKGEEAAMQANVSPVQSFPVRLDVGIVWVWADPETRGFSDAIPLPISPLLRRWHEKHGDGAAFMRDLPYGMELLGENLLDLSHLPFSHHSVGSLSRDIGGPLPLRMLSEKEKKKEAEREVCMQGQTKATTETPISPIFQAQLTNASDHDPMFLSLSKQGFQVPADASCTIAYYDPCHVRYRRVRGGMGQHVELFMTPTRAGHSRVVLYNPAEAFLPPLNPSQNKDKKTVKDWIASFSPAALKTKVQKKIITKLFDPTTSRSHMFSHQIFDGDGIFLNKQGDRMRRRNLSFKDYSTPTEADIMVNAFRRYLDRAAQKTEQAGHALASSTVVSPSASDHVGCGQNHYIDDNDRAKLLDRYQSHTSSCPVCSQDLKKAQRRQKLWSLLQVALVGAAGSSSTVLTGAAALSFLGASSVPAALFPLSGAALVSMALGAVLAGKKEKQLDAIIQKFYFEDYIHAEKD